MKEQDSGSREMTVDSYRLFKRAYSNRTKEIILS